MGFVRIKESKHPRYSHELIWEEAGTVRRAWKRTEAEAKEAAKELKRRLQFVAPADEAVSREETAAVLRARALGVSVREAVEAFALSAAARARSVTVAELVRRRVEVLDREGLRRGETRHFVELRRSMAGIVREWGDRRLADLTRADAQAWIFGSKAGAAPLTVRNRRTVLVGLLEFARAEKLLTENVAQEVKAPRREASESIGILTPWESWNYLMACAEQSGELLALEAVRLFAGLRRAEAERLDWEQVRLDRGFVEVTAKKAKTRQRRLVDVLPALDAILRPLARQSGPLLPKNVRRLRDAAMKAAGWAGDAHSYGKAPEGARPWPGNALRHSFVSYHLAFFNDTSKTELQAGHDAKMLFGHYRELVTPRAAAQFWGLRIAGG